MHFRDSNHEVTRIQRSKTNNIIEQKLRWITKIIWWKIIWVKFSASPTASTNQFSTEDVSHAVKENKKMHRIKVR